MLLADLVVVMAFSNKHTLCARRLIYPQEGSYKCAKKRAEGLLAKGYRSLLLVLRSFVGRKHMSTNQTLHTAQSHHRFTNMYVQDCAVSGSDVI
jgi:hypothetical protein